MKRKLYIFGAQNFADISHYYFSEDSPYEVAGFTVDSAYMKEDSFKGLPVIAYEELRTRISPEDTDLFVAIGISQVNALRAQKFAEVQRDGFRLASFLSSRAHVTRDLVLEPNTMIMDYVAMHPQVKIGHDSIIWSSTRIAFKTCIGNHAWITSAIIGESSVIGDYSFVGLNATIAPFVHVGRQNLIGAAAVILKDTQDNEIYRGPRSRPSRASTQRARDIIR